MAMRAMEGRRDRIKAHLVWIGKPGEKATPVIPKPDKFIDIKWHVLGDWLIIIFGITMLFGCGFLTGVIWMWRG